MSKADEDDNYQVKINPGADTSPVETTRRVNPDNADPTASQAP